MNERLNISELAALLAEHTGKEKKDSELFLRELVAVVSDALFEEHIVKVKGVGTFKVIQVEERESIHVNTGERFTIPGHSKLTFTPDKELRELANKPFASFETTEINDGVVFLNEKEEPEDDPEVTDEENETIAEQDEITKEEQENENTESESGVIPESVRHEPVMPPAGSAGERPAKKRNYLLPLLLLLIVLLCAGGYFIATNKPKTTAGNVVVTAKEKDMADMPGPVEEEVPLLAADSINGKEEVTQPEEKQPVKVKIVPGSRLTLIALEHYGNKVFWVYIYEHNKAIIKNPNNINIGTELIVPDASLYGIDANDPESVATAKIKQAEINSKF